MVTLSTPSATGKSPRPHAWGKASGTKGGTAVTKTVEWLFDTGADVGVVQKQVGKCFDLRTTGASASPTTGSRAIVMKMGMTVSFEVEDAAGMTRTATSSLDVGVKRDNAGSNLIGMEQLADAAVTLEWDPTAQSGRLLI